MVLTRRQVQERDNQAHHVPPRTLQHQAMAVAASTKKDQQNGQQQNTPPAKTAPWVYVLLIGFAVLTYATIPVPLHPTPGTSPTIQHVFYYGWLTAMSTGLGALPFLFFPDVATYWVGISNGTFSSADTIHPNEVIVFCKLNLSNSNG